MKLKLPKDILTYVTAFLVFWIFLFNLNVEEMEDVVAGWEEREMQYLADSEWKEQWESNDSGFYFGFIQNLKTLDAEQFCMELQQFNNQTNFAIGEGLCLDTIEQAYIWQSRENILKVLDIYLHSQMFLNKSIPRTEMLENQVPIGPEALSELQLETIHKLLNEHAVCENHMTPILSRRDIRKKLKSFCHVFNVRGKTRDWYKFELFWNKKPVQGSKPDLVTIKQASNIKLAKKIGEILADLVFAPVDSGFNCLVYQMDFQINLGNAIIKINEK